ncbi:MAG: hypothetical protein HPY80_02795 [Bacteroidales bacterium]|jgi:hypothetical protein|nr:hypothetical protein [Bacteroidales bacterium]NPV35581.1 hypothetical protein [Bacteroidales bacterium]
MKNFTFFVLFAVSAALVLQGCGKDDNNNTQQNPIDEEVLVTQLFTAAMNWQLTPKSSVPVNVSVDQVTNGAKGGNIHVIGSVTGTMNINEQTGEFLGGTLLLGLTETINDLVLTGEDGKDYIVNGAPYLSLAGTFTLLGMNTFGTASHMTIGGGIRITGNGVDITENIQLTINLNATGTGGHVSGKVGDQSVDFTF